MSNRFEIQVVALDRFTKTFHNLNDRASKAVRPLTNVQRQVGALSRELHLDKLAKGMEKVSFASSRIARSVGIVAPQMEAIFGLGLAGGIVGVGAGVLELTSNFGKLGFQVGRTSDLIGISTKDLQELEGAAKLAGLSTESMDQALNSLGNTLEDALFRRNGQAFQILQQLGIHIKRNEKGAVDTAAAFQDLSRAIAAANPQVQQLIAKTFGLESMLPLLRQGPDAIRNLRAEAEKLGYVLDDMSLRKATELEKALHRLSTAFDGVGNSIGARFSPALVRGIDLITEKIRPATKGEPTQKKGFLQDVWDMASGVLSFPVDLGLTIGRSGSGGKLRGVGGSWADSSPIRWNNPGNLRNVGGNGFQSFQTPAAGLQAMARQLGLYYNRDHLDTISSIVNKYAPASDRNNVPAYIADVTGQTGFGADQHLNLNDPRVMAPLLSAMVKHEQGKQPFQQSDYAQAAQTVKVEVSFNGAPPGTTAQAKGPGNAFIPTRVAYVMPSRDMP